MHWAAQRLAATLCYYRCGRYLDLLSKSSELFECFCFGLGPVSGFEVSDT